MTLAVPRSPSCRAAAASGALAPRARTASSRADPAGCSEDALLCHAGVPVLELSRIGHLARRLGVSPRQAARAAGLIDPAAETSAVANAFGLTAATSEIALRPVMPPPPPYRLLTAPTLIPAEGGPQDIAAVAENFTARQLGRLARRPHRDRRRIAVTDRASLSRAIQRAYGPALAEEAANGLAQSRPRFSAAFGLWRWQGIALSVAAGLFAGAAVFTPREAAAVYSAVLSLAFLVTIALRIAAAGHACWRHAKGAGAAQRRPRDSALPRYTVLVAMYREARVLPQLVEALKALNYPAAKLDIKLVLEADDSETIAAARALALPPWFDILLAPPGHPRTKPRALNYALKFATGDLLVIYDAEDRPEPDQLMKAAAHFARAPAEVACLQARLTFDNACENWLAKQFTIEYASLFGGILPMLDAARLPLPLGGTSNHFRVNALRRVGAWDAHNVTEDADLGIRLYRCGLRAEVLDSVTYEEACCKLWPWIRQRTRWLKGWMQTYAVHMREPFRLRRELGWRGFLAFQGQFAGVIIAALVHPVSYLLLAHDAAAGILFAEAESVLGRHLWLLAAFNLVAGYAASLALGYFVLQRRRVRRLVKELVFIPAYWLLISAACYRAVYQLITAPHLWEKTEHGVSAWRRPTRARGAHDGSDAGADPAQYPRLLVLGAGARALVQAER